MADYTENKIKVVRLAHVHYQHPDLNRALLFLNDFGMVEEARVDGKVYLRGYGCQPFLYIAEQSPDDKRHFIGGYWVVAEAAELEKAATKPNASSIQDCEGPGGGKVVTIQDPNGITVGFIHGQVLREQNGRLGYLEREDSGHIANSSTEKPRKGEFRRFDAGASPVHKLGHYGFVVPGDAYEKTQEWYTGLMNLKPTDSVFDPKTGKDETCFNHIDLGSEFTDHHSFFLARGPEHSPTYIHHSSFEVNDFDTQTLGHHWLLKKGWTNCWGVGRHVLGSQIFDYWFDGSGNILEHYSDGDLVNEHTPVGRQAAAPDTLYVWGPNIPLAFVTGQVEDAVKAIPTPPDVVEATPAQF